MRRRRLLIIATVVLAMAGATTVGFAMTAGSTAKPTLSGPIADDAGYSFIYSHVAPGDAVTIASLVVTNTSTKSITLEQATTEGASHVVVLGTYALDPGRWSPGGYRGFPPIIGGKHIAALRRLDALAPLAPGATILLATGLRLGRGQSVGSIRGIQVEYLTGRSTRHTSYGEATELLAR